MSQGEDDVKQGNVKAQENVFKDIENRVRRNAEKYEVFLVSNC